MSADLNEGGLLVSEDLLHLFDEIGEGVIITNRFAEVVGMNRMSEKMFGIGRDVSISKSSVALLNTFHDPTTRARILPANLPFKQAIVSERAIGPREFLITREDGGESFVQISTSPIFGENHYVTGTLGILIDVTNRHALEQMLTQRNLQLSAVNRIATLLNRTIDFKEVLEYSVRQTMDIFTADAGAVLLPDKTGTRIYIAASANLNEEFLSGVHGTRVDSSVFGRVLSSGTVESLNRHLNFHRLPDLIKSSPFDSVVIFPLKSKGKVVGVGGLFSEIERTLEDSQKEIIEAIGTVIGAAIENSLLHEETIQKTKLLESKNQELQQFTYAITHDLKSPILVIEGFAKELKRSGHLDMDQDVLIGAIMTSSGRLHSLVNDLLELARVGSVEATMEMADIGSLVERILGELSYRLTERKIRTTITGKFPVLMVVVGYVERIFSNLIDNSIKYMGNQKEPNIIIGSEEKDDHFLFFVRDNGIGIPEEFHERIFAIFQRIKRRETDNVEGSGLGLAFVRKIVDLSGGTVWVESAGKEMGSTFYFTLPKQ